MPGGRRVPYPRKNLPSMDEYHDMIGVAKAYFQAFATAADVEEQLSPELEFYYPGFGVCQGLSRYADFSRTLSATWERIDFDADNFSYIAGGGSVVVEGTVSGKLANGASFRGHRFCAVLEVKQNAITRLFFYLDPDLAAAAQASNA